MSCCVLFHKSLHPSKKSALQLECIGTTHLNSAGHRKHTLCCVAWRKNCSLHRVMRWRMSPYIQEDDLWCPLSSLSTTAMLRNWFYVLMHI